MALNREYWDSDTFIAYLASEKDDERDVRCIAGIERAERGESQIVTSAIALTEVLYMKGHVKIERAQEKVIQQFFAHNYIHVRTVDRFTAEDARQLIWDWGVAPKDAIHVATAIRESADILYTFDKKLLGLSGRIGSPLLRIERLPLPHDPMKEGLYADPELEDE